MVLSDFDEHKWESLQKRIHEDLEEEGFELFDLQFNRAKGRYLLRVFMDHEKGVNIDDCERVSQRISTSLDNLDLIPGPYVLEVSSPGIDRPLKKEADFRRYQGKSISITFHEPNQKIQSLVGKILSVDHEILRIEDKKKGEHKIPLSAILKARLMVTF